MWTYLRSIWSFAPTAWLKTTYSPLSRNHYVKSCSSETACLVCGRIKCIRSIPRPFQHARSTGSNFRAISTLNDESRTWHQAYWCPFQTQQLQRWCRFRSSSSAIVLISFLLLRFLRDKRNYYTPFYLIAHSFPRKICGTGNILCLFCFDICVWFIRFVGKCFCLCSSLSNKGSDDWMSFERSNNSIFPTYL
jgi:hypothetical protein